MAATLTISSNPRVGVPVTVDGDGFTPTTKVTVTVQHNHDEVLSSEFLSDASGSLSTTDEADPAVQTLTLTGNAVAAETVTIGAVVYTWRAAPTTTANEVKVGATAAESLQNLKDAINLTGTPGTQYGSATVIHPTVSAGAITATTLLLFAKTGGTGGNSLASTETMTNGSFGAATFAGGAAATGRSQLLYTPASPGHLRVTATDGTNSATADASITT